MEDLSLFEANCLIDVTVLEHLPSFKITKSTPYKILCHTEHGEQLTLIFFAGSANFWKASFKIGKMYPILCKVSKFGKEFRVVHPKISKVKPETEGKVGIIKPQYPLTENLKQTFIGGIVEKNINFIKGFVNDWCRRDFVSFEKALTMLHLPQTLEDVANAKKRLAYDELLSQNLAFLIANSKTTSLASLQIVTDRKLIDSLIKTLPFTLTQDQVLALEKILQLQAKPVQDNILLQGDVGSGKTVVALCAALNVIEAGHQVAVMSPTFILAKQTFELFQKVVAQFDIEVIFLSGEDKGSKRLQKLKQIAQNKPLIVVGTHALFSHDVVFGKLGFAIIDEQHRFGIAQRLELSMKENGIKTLLMTATPIPRTLSMALYGDIEIAYIRSKPSNRKDIVTKMFSFARVNEIIEAIKRKIELDERIYWVVPLISKDEDGEVSKNLTSIEERLEILQNIFGREVISVVHGKMKDVDIGLEMQKFSSGITKIMLATTVIEVGVDVPSATVIVIESAESFGLATLHQLRGRVGRGHLQSYCFLIYKSASEQVLTRLNIIKDSTDGFFIAEKDMELRGTGGIFKKMQSGFESFKFVDIKEHAELFNLAKQDAKEYFLQGFERNPNLKFLLQFFNYDQYINFFKN